jgi:hypothetical protein
MAKTNLPRIVIVNDCEYLVTAKEITDGEARRYLGGYARLGVGHAPFFPVRDGDTRVVHFTCPAVAKDAAEARLRFDRRLALSARHGPL